MNTEKSPHSQTDELPAPMPQVKGSEFEVQHAKQVETGANTGSSATNSSQPVSPKAHSGIPTVSRAITNAAGVQPVATPQIADDEDLIEKEWVESAKRIVAQTKGDPHARSENISLVKDDYKKKRFNIDNQLGKED